MASEKIHQVSERKMKMKRPSYLISAVMILLVLAFCITSCDGAAQIKETIKMTSLTLNKSVLALGRNMSYGLSAIYGPDRSWPNGIIWSSDNEEVCTVDQNGVITGVGTGKATVTVSSEAYPEIKAECEVDVMTAYFVSPDGNNETGDGTAENPFLTAEKARDTIRSLDNIPQGGVAVFFRAGEYDLDETLLLTPADSGKEGSPVVYTAYPDENVNIVSKEHITGWRKLTDDELGSDIFGMSDTAKKNVYTADIPQGWRFHYLYVNGKSMQNSRMIESTDWESDWPRAKATSRDYGTEGLKARFEKGTFEGLGGWEDIELKLLTAIWWNVNAPLTNVDVDSSIGYIQSKITSFYPDFSSWGGQYNVMNTPKYLDCEGEWCVDSVRGKVYYWPENSENPNDADIFAPKLYELVRLQGDEEEDGWEKQVEYVYFRGLNFLYSDRIPETEYDPEWLTRNAESPDGMIFMEGVKNCAVENCVIGYSGAQGIVLNHYAQNCSITGNEIAHSSSGGIYLTGYGPGTKDLNKNHYIAKNHIHHTGVDYMHSCAVQFYGSNHNTVEYNYFHDLPYAAVSIIGMAWSQMKEGPSYRDTINTYGENATMYNPRWDEIDRDSIKTYTDSHKYMHSGNNITQYNIIDDYMQTMRDGGSLYAWCSGGDKTWQFNVGSREFTDDWAVRAIHMDDYDGLNYLYKNLFHANGATDNSHTNGTNGGRGDGGKTDLDVWDDTLSDNTWKENIITPYDFPEGYLELRALISKTAGGWRSELPGAIKTTADGILAEATIMLDASGITSESADGAGVWNSLTGGYSAQPGDADTMPDTVIYKSFNALRFEKGKSIKLSDVEGLCGTSGITVVTVSRDAVNEEDEPYLLQIKGNDGKSSVCLRVTKNDVRVKTDGPFTEVERTVPEEGFTSTVFVADGTKKALYIDGIETTTFEDEGKLLSGDKAEIQIGDFNGEVCEVFVFSRALNEEEIFTVNNYLKEKFFTAEDPSVNYELDESTGKSTVTIDCETHGATVYYTLDRSEPDRNSTRYEGPFTIEGTAVLRCIAVKDGWSDSRQVSKVIGVTASVPAENLLIHLDAADAPVQVGSKVDELISRVNGYTAKQSNAGNKPTLVDCGGFYALSFDGDDLMIVNDFLNLEGHTSITVAAVSRCNEKSAAGDGWCNRQSLIMIDESGGYGAIFVGSYREEIRARFGIGTGNNFDSHTVQIKRSAPIEGFTSTIFIKDGKQQSVYADGELVFSEENGRDKIYNTSNTDLRIGTGISGFNGEIAELLIYDSALTEEQVASINRYFETKYFGETADN
jgi:hypothetical protein